jgi:ABC-2 type transport system ATP-binding protein
MILKGLNFKVNNNCVTAFIGENGAGKTTTMEIISGCLSLDQGCVKINDLDIEEISGEMKNMIGYLPERAPLYSELTVLDTLIFVGRIHNLKKNFLNNQINKVIEQFNIKEILKCRIGRLSKGRKQLVAIAQTFIHDPKYVILDEPMEGLDPKQSYDLRNLFKSLSKDKSIMISSHVLSDLDDICTDLVMIKDGLICQQGSYQDLISGKSEYIYELHVERNSQNLRNILTDRMSHEFNQECVIESKKGTRSQVIEMKIGEKKLGRILDVVTALAIENNCGIRVLKCKERKLENLYFENDQ